MKKEKKMTDDAKQHTLMTKQKSAIEFRKSTKICNSAQVKAV